MHKPATGAWGNGGMAISWLIRWHKRRRNEHRLQKERLRRTPGSSDGRSSTFATLHRHSCSGTGSPHTRGTLSNSRHTHARRPSLHTNTNGVKGSRHGFARLAGSTAHIARFTFRIRAVARRSRLLTFAACTRHTISVLPKGLGGRNPSYTASDADTTLVGGLQILEVGAKGLIRRAGPSRVHIGYTSVLSGGVCTQ
jgi:hypothetical protein